MPSEPLILIPPMLCHAGVFLHQIAALSQDYPVMFAPTTQGERMEEIASQILGWTPPKFAVAGLGMGGMVAMEVLRRAPERITRIALMDTNPQADTPEFAASREPLIMQARAGRLKEVVGQEMHPSFLAPSSPRTEIVDFVTEMGLVQGHRAYVRQARAMQRRRDQQATLRKIKQPALVLCGEYDPLNTVRRHEFMAELIPYARLEIVLDAGHLPPLEQPDEVTRILRDWMEQPLVLR